MTIMGIDPGSRNLGYAIVSLESSRVKLLEAGVIKNRTTNINEQIMGIDVGLEELFGRFPIDEVAVENIFFAHNPKTVLKLAQIRGAILLKILQRFEDFYEYSPLEVKRSVVGSGKATKEQVEFMIRRLLGIKKPIRPFDISDAMAVAFTHTQRRKHSSSHQPKS